LEIINPRVAAHHTRIALFDFDGTLSLIRAGWMDVMVPMMVELLSECRSGETEQELLSVVQEFVARLTGKQTIYQMIELAGQMEKRGAKPLDPLLYKRRYLDRLSTKIANRIEELRNETCPPDKYLVPGSRQLLEALAERGFLLYLASGTDQEYVDEEARLLKIDEYFEGIYGALDDYKSFSKAILIQRILSSGEYRGDEFLAFGDGYVEIENVKQVGGVAVGVATDEKECLHVDEWKRARLIGVGADLIVPNYLRVPELMGVLFEGDAVTR
jgi:phosphoglycolate phosphatase-like HAD superfamily hydrolase